MDSRVEFLVVCLTLVTLVKVSNAVKCYKCGLLDTNSNCKDTFNSDGISQTECSTGCAKTKYEVNDAQVVIRGCAAATVTSDDCVSGSHSGQSADICSCSGNLCNTATPMKFSGAGLIVVCVLTLMHKMIL